MQHLQDKGRSTPLVERVKKPALGRSTTQRHPLKFAFVSTMNGAAWGGSEELWSRTALRLAELGHEVRASVLDWSTRPEALVGLETTGAQVTYRPKERTLLGRVAARCARGMFPAPLDPFEARWLKRDAPDLVIVSQGGPWDGVPWMLACGEFGLRYCTIVQANSEIWWPLDEELEDNRRAMLGAERAFFVSKANRDLMQLQCGMPLENAEVVSNPLNVRVGTELPWPGDAGETHLACVARLEPRAKGQDLLFQVLSQPKWKERPVWLNLYGRGPCELLLRSLVGMFGLEKVRFHGHVADVESIWRANHALVLPSRFEGLPLAVVEAMLCGRAVITTDVAGNTELVRDGINGFVAAAPTSRLLDQTLEVAWARRGEWRDLGSRARTDALQAIPVNAVGEFTDKVLELAVASH